MTLSDFEKLQKEAKYKFVCLTDSKNDFIVKWNNPSYPFKKRFDEIKAMLTSAALPDGNYFIKCKTSHYKDAKEFVFPIEKGENITPLKECSTDPEEMAEKPHVLTYESALEMERRIIELESENSNLARQLEEMTDRCEELESQAEETAQEELSEKNPSNLVALIQESAPSIMQMFDRHFELKEKQLELMALQLQRKAPAPAQMQAAELPTVEQVLNNLDALLDSEEIDENMRAQGVANQMAILSELDPETYEKVHAEIYQPITSEVVE